jgi:hypothetical protein
MNSRVALLENSDADLEAEHTISSALQRLSVSVHATALAIRHLWMWIKPSLTAGMLIYFPTGTLRPLSIHEIINRFYCFVTAYATNKTMSLAQYVILITSRTYLNSCLSECSLAYTVKDVAFL